MKKLLRSIRRLFWLLLIGGAVYVFAILPPRFDAKTNVVEPHTPYAISAMAEKLHAGLRVADMHDDLLMWKRDPLKRYKRGQTDLPRLREGGVAVQIFTTVTFVPGHMNAKANKMEKDRLPLLNFVQLWPPKTWVSVRERALYQAEKLQRTAARSEGNFIFARSKGDLKTGLTLRQLNPDIVVGVLGMEGAHPLEGKLENLDVLYNAGFRMIGLQHFFDNRLGGSLHGVEKGGLTPFGRKVVERALQKHMIIDLAHSSENVVADVLDMTDGPVVISHTGIRSLCNHPKRNISDALVARITERGGLIGIGFWEMAVCDTTPDGIAKMIIGAAEKFGVDYIALGSDFDGAVKTRIAGNELAALTDALLRQGMSEEDIAKVMGENEIRFLLENLPDD